MISDDMATQRGPLIKPEFYCKVIKPKQKELITTIKQKIKAKIFLHSCWSVYQFITDFIEIGVDILNPIQVSAKNMEDTKN